MGYVYQEFPKSKYHADGRVCVVKDAGEELALGPGWVDRPSQLSVVPAEAPVVPSPVPVKRGPGRPRKVPEL
jgi:hypothetical protein